MKLKKEDVMTVKETIADRSVVLHVSAGSVGLWRRLLSVLRSRAVSDAFVRAFLLLVLERLVSRVGGVIDWEVM